VEVDLKNKPQELLKLNPYGKVPVLVDDQAVVYESNIIDEYLDEKYPDVRLMPGDPAARARVRIWMDYCNTRLHGAAHEILHGKDQEKAQAKLKEYLTELEPEMAGREYIAGDYSLADVTLIPFFIRRQRYRFEIDERLPNLQRWMERVLARPAVKSTL
jgi:RNA polymerase-associated protein